MKKYILAYVVFPIFIGMSCLSTTAFSQSVPDSTLLGLPGDNLDLYAVLDLFQQSKTIEDFEKSLNLEKTGINNLDLDLDKKVDFIKVVTKQDKNDFTFVLQVAVSKTETQDVAAIFVSKDDKGKVTMQIVGDEALYGKNHVVELKESSTPAVTANPAYKGPDTVKVVTAPAKTTTVIVEQAPVVQYVYSPAYVPYVPPYYYGFYPPYFTAFAVMSIGFYWGAHAHYHYGGYGYHGNTVIINNNSFNNYNRTRNTSNTVNRNNREGNYSRNNAASTRPATADRSRGGASPSTADRSRTGASTSDRSRTGASASTREAGPTRDAARTSPSTRQSGGAGPTREAAGQTPSNRQAGVSSQPSRSSSNGASRYSGGGSRGSSSYSGGGFSGGASRGGGFSGGGGARGGGGRRR
jgi:hypothetical protein